MKISFIYYIRFYIVLSILILATPYYARAETHIRSGDIRDGTVWTKENSPYILDESIRVNKGSSFTIKAGVTIMPASSTDFIYGTNTITIDGGNLYIMGSVDDPVKIYDLDYIYFTHGNTRIENAILSGTGLDLFVSTTTIFNTEISNTNEAIYAKGSNIKINESKLLNNIYGIYSAKYSSGPFLMYENLYDNENGYGGIGNVLGDIIDIKQNIISITESSILGNTKYGIYNEIMNTISAPNNWWGSTNGPRTDIYGVGDRIYGLVNTEPWMDKDPNIICCSNIIFLPGIESSRLYKDSHGYFGTSTDKLWEPYGNSQVRQLFMDSSGNSLDSSIYTADIIDSAYKRKDIYKSFIAMMNSVVAEKQINKWLSFPYDWRQDISEIVYGDTKLSTSSVSLLNSIEDLADNSKTGKVIIIAHSNGGLIAKMLVHALEEKGKSDIVEKIISIAVPELGTPQAVLAMLHGHNQSIGNGIFVSEKNARILSQNMPGAYGLLPSKKFFEKGYIKIISDYISNKLGTTASTYDAMKNFLLKNSFSKNESDNVNIPLILNSKILSSTDTLHSILDTWRPASSIKTISLIGWGLPTSEGIEYKTDEHCDTNKLSECEIYYSPILNNYGDGTVLTKSSSNLANTSLFFNLKEFKKDTDREIAHADIMETTDTLDMIKKQIFNESPKNEYGKYITTEEPVDNDKWLTIEIHSPVDIDIYDKEGNHTGLITDQILNENLNKFENKVPASFYGEFGKLKLVRLLYGNDYQIVLKGNDTGPFIIKTRVEQFGKTIVSNRFSEIPATPLTNIEMIIPTSTESFATSTLMYIDIDGDGITDITNRTDEYLNVTSTELIADYASYLESIRKTILALSLSKKEEKKWTDRIDKLSKILDKKYSKKVEKAIKYLSKKRFSNSINSLDNDKKAKLLEVFNTMLKNLEKNENIDG